MLRGIRQICLGLSQTAALAQLLRIIASLYCEDPHPKRALIPLAVFFSGGPVAPPPHLLRDRAGGFFCQFNDRHYFLS